MDNTQKIGTLKYWHRDKAFGVLRAPNEFNVWTEYFVHVSNVISGDPVIGCRAEFIVGGKTRGALLPALQVKFTPKISASVIAATLTTAARSLSVQLQEDGNTPCLRMPVASQFSL